MRKTLIIGIALSLVLLSGGLFSAQAGCSGGSLCGLHCGSRDADRTPIRDVETAQASCSGGCLSFLSPCNWHLPSLCGLHCGSRDADRAPARDADR